MTEETKKHAQQRFSRFAEGYVTSQTHAAGADLDRLVAMAQPQADWLVLDIATGGGHTALRFAPHVRQVIAADLTPRMLTKARDFITVPNVGYVATDAENLTFPSNVFDLVTCRIAPHHFPDAFRFVQECRRVAKPGGLVLVEDNLMPEDEAAARYVNAFEKLRDPSHFRAFAEYEWRGMYLDAGLTIERVAHHSEPGRLLLPWAERQGCTPDVIDRLHILLAQAPPAVVAFMHPQHAGTPAAQFDHHYLLIMGRK